LEEARQAEQFWYVNNTKILNSLTPKSVPAGTKNSRLDGFLLAKHKDKHPHHDGAVFPSSGMVLMVKRTPTP
jgi:hypothetical protein